jgi:hypothetical protein
MIIETCELGCVNWGQMGPRGPVLRHVASLLPREVGSRLSNDIGPEPSFTL